MAVKNRGTANIWLYGGLTLFFLLTVSACRFGGGSNAEDESWKDEVLLAHECGMDGLRCCQDSEQPCFYGQVCCTDPHDMKRNYCADNCACGGLKKFCCADDPKCDKGSACGDGYCLPCGENDQLCCDNGNSCHGGLVCHGGSCRECGMSGNPCCTGELPCTSQLKMDDTRTECQSGICIPCGSSGNAGCLAEPYCLPGHLFNNGICLVCGGFNQPCCAPDAVTGELCGQGGLECRLGFCGRPE